MQSRSHRPDISKGLLCRSTGKGKTAFTFEQALTFHRRLNGWKDARPEALEPRRNPLRHIILLFLRYDDVLIAIYKPFVNDSPPGQPWVDIVLQDTRAQKNTVACIENLKDLVAMHYFEYGWTHCLPYMLHKLAIIAFHELEFLSDANARVSFINAIDAIRQMALSWFVAKPILRMIEVCVEYLRIELPNEAWDVLRGLRDDQWIKDGVDQVLQKYPSGAFRTYFNDTRLETLLDDWEKIGNLDNSSFG